MKKITLLFLFFSCTFLFAQESITKNLGDFNKLKVFRGLTVDLQKSDSSKIEILGEKAYQVSVKNINGKLKISLKFPDAFVAENLKITLYYANNIAVFDANEGSIIRSIEVVSQQNITAKAQEGAKITMPIKAKYLTVKAVTGGVVNLTGEAQNQQITATTGGIYKAYNVVSKQSTVTAASGAIVKINSLDVLDTKVRFGGTVYYRGAPEVLTTRKFMGGAVIPVD